MYGISETSPYSCSDILYVDRSKIDRSTIAKVTNGTVIHVFRRQSTQNLEALLIGIMCKNIYNKWFWFANVSMIVVLSEKKVITRQGPLCAKIDAKIICPSIIKKVGKCVLYRQNNGFCGGCWIYMNTLYTQSSHQCNRPTGGGRWGEDEGEAQHIFRGYFIHYNVPANWWKGFGYSVQLQGIILTGAHWVRWTR